MEQTTNIHTVEKYRIVTGKTIIELAAEIGITTMVYRSAFKGVLRQGKRKTISPNDVNQYKINTWCKLNDAEVRRAAREYDKLQRKKSSV